MARVAVPGDLAEPHAHRDVLPGMRPLEGDTAAARRPEEEVIEDRELRLRQGVRDT